MHHREPAPEARDRDLAPTPAWHLLEHPVVDEVEHVALGEAGEARHLADRYPGGVAPWARAAMADVVGLDRGPGDEAGPGGVGLGVDFELAGAGERGGGGSRWDGGWATPTSPLPVRSTPKQPGGPGDSSKASV